MSHELPHTPGHIAPPPAHLMHENQWSPTVVTNLQAGESFTLSVGETITSPSAIGIDDSSGRFSVVGRVGDSVRDKDPAMKGLDFAIVKYAESSGEDSLFIVTDYTDEKGITSKKYTPVPWGVPLTVGRSTKANSLQEDEPTFLSGQKLYGEEFGRNVSRKHLTLVWTKDGVVISDNSTNGTRIEGKQATAGRKLLAAGGVLQASGAMIDAVPEATPTPESHSTPEARRKEELALLIARSDEGLGKIADAISSKDDLTKLWNFGVKSAHYRSIAARQQRGELGTQGHRYTDNAYAEAIDAERKLPQSVMAYASDYRTHMVNKVLAQEELKQLG